MNADIRTMPTLGSFGEPLKERAFFFYIQLIVLYLCKILIRFPYFNKMCSKASNTLKCPISICDYCYHHLILYPDNLHGTEGTAAGCRVGKAEELGFCPGWAVISPQEMGPSFPALASDF